MAAIVDPGDEVILHEPSYVAYLPAILFNGGTPVLVPTDREAAFELDPAAVEAAITPRTKVIFLGYPCNPTGAVLPEATLRAIADIAARHDLLVVSDEIYDRLVYGDHRHQAFSSFEGARDRTILLGGFSKAYAMTGWRVGWAAAPPGPPGRHRQGPPVPDHVGADDRPGRGPGGPRERRDRTSLRMVAEYDRRRRMFVDGLNRIGLPTFEPRGAFYAFPQIAGTGLSSQAFSERLLFEAEGRRGARATRSDHRARAMCVPATQPATSSSRRRWGASSVSSTRCDGIGRIGLPTACSHASARFRVGGSGAGRCVDANHDDLGRRTLPFNAQRSVAGEGPDRGLLLGPLRLVTRISPGAATDARRAVVLTAVAEDRQLAMCGVTDRADPRRSGVDAGPDRHPRARRIAHGPVARSRPERPRCLGLHALRR